MFSSTFNAFHVCPLFSEFTNVLDGFHLVSERIKMASVAFNNVEIGINGFKLAISAIAPNGALRPPMASQASSALGG